MYWARNIDVILPVTQLAEMSLPASGCLNANPVIHGKRKDETYRSAAARLFLRCLIRLLFPLFQYREREFSQEKNNG